MSDFFEAPETCIKKSVTKKSPIILDPKQPTTKQKLGKRIAMTQDCADFFMNDTDASARKKTRDLIEVKDPVYYSDPNPKIYIAISIILNETALRKFIYWFKKTFPNLQIALVYCFTHNLDDHLDDGNLTSTMGIKWSKYIPESSVLISIGNSAMRALTSNSDLMVHGFYDTQFNQPWFYAPRAKSWVFPCDKFSAFWSSNQSCFMDTFAKHFFIEQIKKASNFKKPSRIPPDPVIVHVSDPNTFLASHKEACPVVWDLETSGFHFIRNKIVCLTLTFDGVTGYFLPWDKIDPKILNEFFSNKYQVGANLKFDCKFVRHRGVSNAKIDFDTLNAGHVLNEMRSNSLKTHAFLFTPWGGYDDELEAYKKKYKMAADDYSLIPIPILRPYATMDVIVTYRVWQKMVKQLAEDPLVARYYYEDVIPSLNLYLKSELRGLDVDWVEVKKIGIEMKKLISAAKEKAFAAVGRSFNIDSPTELGKFIEFELKWPCIERTKAGYFKTGKESMNEWKKMGFKEAALILEYNQLVSTFNSFVGDEEDNNGIWQHRVPGTDAIYPTFSVMLAKSGRNRSNGPNFQNFPKRSKVAKLLRQMFKAPKGFQFMETDGAGLQLRIGASHSNDAAMREAFLSGGGDLHSITGMSVFCNRWKIKTATLTIGSEKFQCSSLDPIEVIRNGVKEAIPLDQWKIGDQIVSVNRTLSGQELLSFEKPIKDFTIQISGEGLDFSISDFKKLKGFNPYKDKRTKAKNCNFGLLFGSSAVGFGLGLLHQEWTVAECDAYIALENLQEGVQKYAKNESFTLDQAKYIACAERISEIFFQLYPGLKSWQEANIKFAEDHGYIRSPFGARRLLPELLYQGSQDEKSHIKNLKNITANSPVQNHEVVVMHRAMRHIDDYIVAHKLESIVIGNVHDAAVGYLKNTELRKLIPVIDEGFSLDFPENNGIPYEGATNLADPAKGEGWGFGKTEIETDDVGDFDFNEYEDYIGDIA